MKWWLYPEQPEPNRNGLPLLVTGTVMLVVIIICIGIQAVVWPENKHVDLSFFLRPVVFPFFLMLALINFVLIFENTVRHYYETRIYNEKVREYGLKQYAQMRLFLAGWSTLSTLDEPALNMLKLEGEFPLAPKTPLTIPLEETFELTRNQQIFNQLLTPLVDKLKASCNGFKACLWVRGGNESCSEELKYSLEKLNIPATEISYLAECPGYTLLNEWMRNDYVIKRLLIIIDMHEEDKPSKSMENATALLLTNSYGKVEGEKTIYIFRPITDITDPEETIPVYLKTEQVKEPKTLWYTGLTKSQKYPLLKILDDWKMAANRLELEGSFGSSTEGYRWFALALAADGVKYAQGPQFIAASTDNKLSLVALSSKIPKALITKINTNYRSPWEAGGMFGVCTMVTILIGLAAFAPQVVEHMSVWLFIFIIVLPLFVGLTTGAVLTSIADNKADQDMWL
ncbi:hypothetical protein KI694_00120 [Enterobacter oligotrophicus]|uniref:hypothetical protein n=1 Tax=Enterobacter oligotrophicus TaxID=2478464 RepID=UPI001C02A390|nr:hypothetical protein [Enterobacter oligotrophicus]ELW1647680.1 hypothetical protein [Enterobacter oligotrophicus]MBT9423938.1 hypothetical protein [Enterobacter oligotrophicus]